MPKVTFIGAGSAVFARQLMTDILAVEGLDEGEFALCDIDAGRLDLTRRIAERLIALTGKHWVVRASTERRELLPGSDFIVNSIEVAGLANVRHDYDIPLKYGVDQCIGDTIGPGGVFKALRTGPAWLAILRDCERLCPDAWVLNYTNPMSILTLAALTDTGMRTVGLCHSVQNTSRELAGYLQIPHHALEFTCAGINHNAWFITLRHGGQDLYPRLRERAMVHEVYEQDLVRFDMMRHFGAFVTESSGHFSEYVPYYRKRPDLIARYCRAGYLGESGFYANNWPRWREENDARIAEMLAGTREVPLARSHEYGSSIIEGISLNRPQVIYGNVRNRDGGLIDNLPDGCVEVACLVDRNGVQPAHFGPLPEQLAALNRAHMAVHALMVEALRARDREAARQALQLDPLTAAVCAPAEIDALFDEMWAAERAFLLPFERSAGGRGVAGGRRMTTDSITPTAYDIPQAWERGGLVLPRAVLGPDAEVLGDPCVVWDDEIGVAGGWRMVLFADPPGHGQAVCRTPGDVGPGRWEFLGPLPFANPDAILGGYAHKPYIVMEARRSNRAALIDGRYCLLLVVSARGRTRKRVQRAWAERLAGPWTLEEGPFIVPGVGGDFDARHVDAVSAMHFPERGETLYFYMGYPEQPQPWPASPYGSAQGVAVGRNEDSGVTKLGVVLPPDPRPEHWAGGYAGGLQVLPGSAHHWWSVANASPTPPNPSDPARWREEPPPSLAGLAWCDEEWPVHGWQWAPEPLEWIEDMPAEAISGGEGVNLWRQHILALPDGRLALFYNSGQYGAEQLYMKVSGADGA